MSWRRLSDEQFIARIRRFHERRRTWGLILFLAGAVATAGLYWAHTWLGEQGLEKMARIGHDVPLGPENATKLVETRMLAGFAIGFALGFGAVGATMAAGWGLCLLLKIPDQKTELLLKYYDAHQTPPSDSGNAE